MSTHLLFSRLSSVEPRVYALIVSGFTHFFKLFPVISAGFCLNPALLCFGQRVPSGFLFLTHELGVFVTVAKQAVVYIRNIIVKSSSHALNGNSSRLIGLLRRKDRQR